MLRDCWFPLVVVVWAALFCADVRGQAPPSQASSSVPVQTPGPTQSAPAQGAPTNPTSSPAESATQGPIPHIISVTFDYDFDRTPACTENIKRRCVQQFVVYDISADPKHPYRIGVVALPDHPFGQRRAIPGKTDPHIFESGRHLIAVTAQEPEPQPHPLESTTIGCASCTAWVKIP
jgi:hypothetical protein